MDIISYALSKKGTAQAVSDYLGEHLTNPTNPPIDNSLTIENAAADAKKTGDELSDLKEGFTAITDNEVVTYKDKKDTGTAANIWDTHTGINVNDVPYLYAKVIKANFKSHSNY